MEKNISRDELNDAINQFLKKGGQIKTVPEKKIIQRNAVGEKYSAYESIDDFSFFEQSP